MKLSTARCTLSSNSFSDIVFSFLVTKLQKDLPITLGLTIINTIGRNNVEKLQIPARLSGDYYSPTIEENLPAVVFRTHREVNPIGGTALLED